MKAPKACLALLLLAGVALLILPGFSQQRSNSLLIRNAQIADGTGAPLYKGNVRIARGHIIGIGELQPDPG